MSNHFLDGVTSLDILDHPTERRASCGHQNAKTNLKDLEAKIVDLIVDQLGSFKRPIKVLFLDQLPKTVSGKPIRNQIAPLFLNK
ncbi:MAG: hypothetical protein D6732_16990 [Methanobacteriota archaeon]|nr:MAG: hypothetical protein D6732_16990 [Euryarchaeota archaeon]